jgi:nicotinic acid mononucleotide adenylyltransferase
MGPSGVRIDKTSYRVADSHRRRMLEIMIEEHPELNGGVIPDFDFIDAPREKSATHGVHAWFEGKYQVIPRQIFGTDVIPNIDRCWMQPDWVKREASKLFVPRGDDVIDYTGLGNYIVMPFRASRDLMELSSSRVRANIPQGDFTGLSEGVAEYIQRHGLYLPQTNKSTVSMHVNHQKPLHVKSRHQKANDYPERFHVPDDRVFWDADFEGYMPVQYTAEVVTQQFIKKGAQ